MIAIYKRELKSYFTSVVAQLFIAVLVAVTGIYFMVYNMHYGYPYFSYTLNSVMFIMAISIPVLTMRSMADDRRQKTDQMLLTAPVSVSQIIGGKYLALLTVLCIPCLLFCLCPIIIRSTGTAYLLIDYSSIFCFFLIGAAFMAVGLLVSSLTENMIIAAVGTIGLLVLNIFFPGLASFMPETAFASLIGWVAILTLCVFVYHSASRNVTVSLLIESAGILLIAVLYMVKPEIYEGSIANLMNSLALTSAYTSFASDYIFDIPGLIRLLTVIFVCLFLTVQTVQKRRWS